MTRRIVALASVIVFVWLSSSLAGAAAIPGATYVGTTSKGGSVDFTVSNDGTLVNSYRISGLSGRYTTGRSCVFVAGGSPGVWEGVPIVNNAFNYAATVGAEFQGSFHGPRSMTGTLRIYQPATPQSPACSSGAITWTATTRASPVGGNHSQAKRTYATGVSLRKLSSAKLEGRVSSANKRCLTDRAVTLWVGAVRSATTHSSANGGFQFARRPAMQGQDLRASVSSLKLTNQSCGAASSKFLRG